MASAPAETIVVESEFFLAFFHYLVKEEIAVASSSLTSNTV